MSRKIIEQVEMGRTWTSYIASVEGALRAAGLWSGETWKLMGMTGIGFHFIMHNQVCPSSVTVYDWSDAHLMAMDRIGIHSEFFSIMNVQMNTYPQQQKSAVERIKSAIDSGHPVIIWAPTAILEFGIIYGYDDDDGVFFTVDCTGTSRDPLLYSNIGLSEVPTLGYQIFYSSTNVDQEKIFAESLRYGLSEWEKEFHLSPVYSSGRKAYQNLIHALKTSDFSDFGLSYTLAVYADAKNQIAQYLHFVEENSTRLKGLHTATANFKVISQKYQQLTKLFPFGGSNGSGCTINRDYVPQALNIIEQCSALEEEAFMTIKAAIG